MAPAAIRMRLTPSPISTSFEVFIVGRAASPFARDGHELEVCADFPEQPVKPAASRSDVAVASSSPTTSGTDTCFEPDEMLIRTSHPRFTFLPASGYCATTVRAGLLLGT